MMCLMCMQVCFLYVQMLCYNMLSLHRQVMQQDSTQ